MIVHRKANGWRDANSFVIVHPEPARLSCPSLDEEEAIARPPEV
jgi:hypothetical protein